MSKGIIVVDIPDFCMDCNFCREIDEGIEACCEMTVDYDNNDCYRMIDDYCQSKPDWCPIVPLKQMKLHEEHLLQEDIARQIANLPERK